MGNGQNLKQVHITAFIKRGGGIETVGGREWWRTRQGGSEEEMDTLPADVHTQKQDPI